MSRSQPNKDEMKRDGVVHEVTCSGPLCQARRGHRAMIAASELNKKENNTTESQGNLDSEAKSVGPAKEEIGKGQDRDVKVTWSDRHRLSRP